MLYSKTNLKKLEDLIKDLKYILRYEKGNFNSGYCLINDNNVILINKFLTQDVKFQKILEILPQLNIKNINNLNENSLNTFKKIQYIFEISSEIKFTKEIEIE